MLFYTNVVCDYTCMHVCPGGYRRIHTMQVYALKCYVEMSAYMPMGIYVSMCKHSNICITLPHACVMYVRARVCEG